jgi:hypothetical protein
LEFVRKEYGGGVGLRGEDRESSPYKKILKRTNRSEKNAR